MGCKPSTTRPKRSNLHEMSRKPFGHAQTTVTAESSEEDNRDKKNFSTESDKKKTAKVPSLQIQPTQESAEYPTSHQKQNAAKNKKPEEAKLKNDKDQESSGKKKNYKSDDKKSKNKNEDGYHKKHSKERKHKKIEHVEREKGEEYANEIKELRKDKHGRRILARMDTSEEDDTLYEVYEKMPSVSYVGEIHPPEARASIPARVGTDREQRRTYV
ncbi:unnamed protein product [Bursaphelenchus okinawaensis]|uniref:Uncharacterized protein n=1 Tax=Bursaphelenchus okinawaensis TaxID=465554 RepID=A0A811LD44_9BILA|nr:unnamed protein product [Bursaphelenchus okinawaensis]CAG9120501.1 unnamed protein product [Bursaphelenchus okinawaensis]